MVVYLNHTCKYHSRYPTMVDGKDMDANNAITLGVALPHRLSSSHWPVEAVTAPGRL